MAVQKRFAAALVLLLSLSSGVVFAQNFGDLDLTEDPKKEEKKEPPKDELDLTAPDKKPAPKTGSPKDDDRKPLKADKPTVERDVTQDDRVKSVQRKLYIKRGRFELAPAAIININDPYYTRVGGQIRLAFYPADTLAIAAVSYTHLTLPTSDLV